MRLKACLGRIGLLLFLLVGRGACNVRSLTIEYEERETQAAEPRLPDAQASGPEFWMVLLCFFNITMMFSRRPFRVDDWMFIVWCPLYSETPGDIPPQVTRLQILKSESLILAQNERWRQA